MQQDDIHCALEEGYTRNRFVSQRIGMKTNVVGISRFSGENDLVTVRFFMSVLNFTVSKAKKKHHEGVEDRTKEQKSILTH